MQQIDFSVSVSVDDGFWKDFHMAIHKYVLSWGLPPCPQLVFACVYSFANQTRYMLRLHTEY